MVRLICFFAVCFVIVLIKPANSIDEKRNHIVKRGVPIPFDPRTVTTERPKNETKTIVKRQAPGDGQPPAPNGTKGLADPTESGHAHKRSHHRHPHRHHHHRHHHHHHPEKKGENTPAATSDNQQQPPPPATSDNQPQPSSGKRAPQLGSYGGGYNANLNQNNKFSPSFGNIGDVGKGLNGRELAHQIADDLSGASYPSEEITRSDLRHFENEIAQYYNLLKLLLLPSRQAGFKKPDYFFDFRNFYMPNAFPVSNLLGHLEEPSASTSISSSESDSGGGVSFDSNELFGRTATKKPAAEKVTKKKAEKPKPHEKAAKPKHEKAAKPKPHEIGEAPVTEIAPVTPSGSPASVAEAAAPAPVTVAAAPAPDAGVKL